MSSVKNRNKKDRVPCICTWTLTCPHSKTSRRCDAHNRFHTDTTFSDHILSPPPTVDRIQMTKDLYAMSTRKETASLPLSTSVVLPPAACAGGKSPRYEACKPILNRTEVKLMHSTFVTVPFQLQINTRDALAQYWYWYLLGYTTYNGIAPRCTSGRLAQCYGRSRG